MSSEETLEVSKQLERLEICKSCEHCSQDHVGYDCCALKDNDLIIAFVLDECPDGRWV